MFEQALSEVTSMDAVQELNCARIAIIRMVEIIKELDRLDVVVDKVKISGFEPIESPEKLRDTASGHKYIYKQNNIWAVSVPVKKKMIHLGTFKNVRDAVKFRDLFLKKQIVNLRTDYLMSCNVKIFLNKTPL